MIKELTNVKEEDLNVPFFHNDLETTFEYVCTY